MNWIRVSKTNPCAICQKPDYCGHSDNGEICICMRVESPFKSKNGGYIHRLMDKPLIVPERRKTEKPVSLFNAKLYMENIRANWDSVLCDGIAVGLGVNIDALERLCPGWDYFNNAIGFPMRSGSGEIVGIRLRNLKGRKWAVKGSKEGLFFDPSMTGDEMTICEGPTDTLAVLSLGLFGVGRPSCNGCFDHLKELVRAKNVKRITIMADNDNPKKMPDGKWWRPGNEGAERLGHELKKEFRVVYPAIGKDVRAWVQSMSGVEDFERQASTSKWHI